MSILKHIVCKWIVLDSSPFQGTSDTHKMPLWEEKASNLLTETLAWPYHCHLWGKRKNDLKALLGRKDMATTTGKSQLKRKRVVSLNSEYGDYIVKCLQTRWNIPKTFFAEDYIIQVLLWTYMQRTKSKSTAIPFVSFYLFLYQNLFLCNY